MTSQHPPDQYKVPRESVNVESLAQELSRYLKITAEDTEFLSHHPTRRDELVAELYAHPNVKSEQALSANQIVQVGGDPDAHLVPANAEIKRRVCGEFNTLVVVWLASTWLLGLLWSSTSTSWAMPSSTTPTILWHATDSMDEWHKTEFARLFPESAAANATSATPTAPAPASLPKSPESIPSSSVGASDVSAGSRPVSNDEAAQFLHNPDTLIGKRFVCSPPDDNDSVDLEDRGLWEVVSFRAHMDEGVVDREYMVLTEDLPDDPLPMGEEQVRAMLRFSTFAG